VEIIPGPKHDLPAFTGWNPNIKSEAGLDFSPDPTDPTAGSGRIRNGFETAGPAPGGRLAARLRLAWPGLAWNPKP
jgi:hypothetical protein